MKGIRLLLLFFPVAMAAEFLHWGDLVIFAASALAIIPIAGLLGDATEALAEKTGPQIGGLLNASLGNVAELHGTQKFDRSRISVDANLVILAAIAISIPSLFNEFIEPDFQRVEMLSLTTAAVMLLLYALSIVYTLRQPATNHTAHGAAIEPTHAGPPRVLAAPCWSW